MSITKTQSKVKPVRSASLSTMTNGKLCLWLRSGGNLDGVYTLTPIPSDFGVAYQLGKATPDGCSESYDVLLYGRETSCTCPGHTYTGRCKHVLALEALTAAGKLPYGGKATPAAPDVQSMKCGTAIQLGGHRVERVASGWLVDGTFASSPRQLAQCLAACVSP